jgi:hypothetical protein
MVSTTRPERLVTELCSPSCAGRRSGTLEGEAARAVVISALREAGLDPFEQPVPGCGGANVLATIHGDVERYVVVGAHFDHLGRRGSSVYWGADDNAAAVAVLVEVASVIAQERRGRGVVIAAFDGEEPPFFLTGAMGSQRFVADPPVPRGAIDFMVCMDIVGHRVGPPGLPDEVGRSLFALGGERSRGTLDVVRAANETESGVRLRPMNADIVEPLSDYEPFWRARIPFLFLTAGRSHRYHTPEDTPDALDYPKIDATARWLTEFVRVYRSRPDPIVFDDSASDDTGTLDEIASLVGALPVENAAQPLLARRVAALRRECDVRGRLPPGRRAEMGLLVGRIEAGLALWEAK